MPNSTTVEENNPNHSIPEPPELHCMRNAKYLSWNHFAVIFEKFIPNNIFIRAEDCKRYKAAMNKTKKTSKLLMVTNEQEVKHKSHPRGQFVNLCFLVFYHSSAAWDVYKQAMPNGVNNAYMHCIHYFPRLKS